MKKIMIISICFFLLTFSCAGPQRHGMGSIFAGIAHLVLSPVQIAAGLIEGISSLPYYLSTNIHEINKGLIDAQAKITLDDTYDSAYGKRLSQVPQDGNTGEVFRRMKNATKYFQVVLKKYGIRNANRYILTSIDTANSEGYTLFAVVYRSLDYIEVIDKYDGRTLRKFSKEDRLYYEPFERDASGQSLDEIIDWTGIPRDIIKTQKAQALLITLAANAVVDGKRSQEYWEAERKWIGGDFLEIVSQKSNKARERMKI